MQAAVLFHRVNSLVLLAFALLIGYAAGGFASGLAGGLALAATAVVDTFVEITSLKCFNPLHEAVVSFYVG